MKKVLKATGLIVFVFLCLPTVAKTLIIGDSLSSAAGNFGSGLAEFFAKRTQDTACVLSVSGSKFSDWTDVQSPLMSSPKFGASFGKFDFEARSEKVVGSIRWTDNSKVHPWSLTKTLKAPQIVCGDSRPVEHLVVQLGSNESANNEDLGRYKKILELAEKSGVKKVDFILAPRNRAKNFKSFNKLAAKQIPWFLREYSTLDIGVFNSTEEVVIRDSDFRPGDSDHFWKSPGEQRWLNKVKDFFQMGV